MTTVDTNPVDELGVGAAFLLREPERAADFADMAWVAAQALGDGTGVRSLEAEVNHRDGRPWVKVQYTAAARVHEIAARFGWDVRGNERCVYASGYLGTLVLWVEWFAPRKGSPAVAG